MSTAPTIRPATPDDDVDQVFDLLWQLAPADDRPAREALAAAWRGLHARPGWELLLAHLGPRLVGTLDTLVVPNLTREAAHHFCESAGFTPSAAPLPCGGQALSHAGNRRDLGRKVPLQGPSPSKIPAGGTDLGVVVPRRAGNDLSVHNHNSKIDA
ncbi:hypothetical protein O7598_07100 [Micromonospora sp. WMMC241]|uniref:hypothetical protein n=1 Tax=Micromonospora sp. WMMC241 TaxID=3015159 RepID=UPI0022B6B344|nr:hypothetical protein [Micromonospora sp. WMMC241]MCZ7436152.1 hypothetical protein [Micromonospora sp. WMMC241]